MTNEQAIAYIESIITNYDVPKFVDAHNPTYHYCGIWLGDKDMIALKMGIEALKENKDA